MYSFNGKFNVKLDDKNRIRIPAKYKAELEGGYKLSCGANNTINVLPLAEYKKTLDSFGDVSIFDVETQEAITDFTSSVFDVAEDPQGRIVIPQELKEHAGIDKDIVVIGAASYLRIESAEHYAARTAGKDMGSVFERLRSLGAGRRE